MREFRLMNIQTEQGQDHWLVNDTAGPDGFKSIRSNLAAGYRLESYMADISVVRYQRESDRKLLLQHQSYNGRTLLPEETEQTLKHLRWLWGFDVSLESLDQSGRCRSRLIEKRVFANVQDVRPARGYCVLPSRRPTRITIMLRSVKSIEGLSIKASDGLIGKATDFYFDDEAWVVRFLVGQHQQMARRS